MNAILLIDDDPLQLRTREQILRQAGVEVHIATAGDSAVALLRSPLGKVVRAVVSDHLMPGLSGPELVRQLHAAHPGVAVIISSGLPDAEDEYEGLDVIFLQKPTPPMELIRAVRSCLQHKAA